MEKSTEVLPSLEKSWDSFFLTQNTVTEDFMTERTTQVQTKRESFED